MIFFSFFKIKIRDNHIRNFCLDILKYDVSSRMFFLALRTLKRVHLETRKLINLVH